MDGQLLRRWRPKMWKAARRAGHLLGRDQVARLMRAEGIEGVRRCRRCGPIDLSLARRPDLVRRDFTAAGPNQLWVTDLTCGDLGWSGLRLLHRRYLLADDRGLAGRFADAHHDGPRCHRDGSLVARDPTRGPAVSQRRRVATYVGCDMASDSPRSGGPSIGTVGDSFDNALAETVNGYYKAEVIR